MQSCPPFLLIVDEFIKRSFLARARPDSNDPDHTSDSNETAPVSDDTNLSLIDSIFPLCQVETSEFRGDRLTQ